MTWKPSEIFLSFEKWYMIEPERAKNGDQKKNRSIFGSRVVTN